MWRLLQLAIIVAFVFAGNYVALRLPEDSFRGAMIIATALGFGAAFLVTMTLSWLLDRRTRALEGSKTDREALPPTGYAQPPMTPERSEVGQSQSRSRAAD